MRAEILTELQVRRAPSTGRPRYALISPFVVRVSGVKVEVPAGYEFDGASIPRLLWWAFPPSYGPAWQAAAFHDYAYTHLYKWMSKRFADTAFRALMLADGAHPWVAGLFYQAVSRFGRGGW